jgi:hypothetical protein
MTSKDVGSNDWTSMPNQLDNNRNIRLPEQVSAILAGGYRGMAVRLVRLPRDSMGTTEMTETKRLHQIWRQLRDCGSTRGFEIDYRFLRSCAHCAGGVDDASS